MSWAGHMFHMDGWSGPWGLIGLGFMIAFWALVIAVIVALVRRPRRGLRRSSALQLLEERYARGEISRDEFIERRDTLSPMP